MDLTLTQCFIFGATEQDVREVLELIDRCVEGMRTQVVDDVHIISDIATYASVVTTNIRSKFIRIAAPGGGSGSASRDRTPLRLTEPHGHSHLADQRSDQSHQYQHNSSGPFGYAFDSVNNHTVDPLADIPSQSLDATLHLGGTYMPPPNFNFFMNTLDGTENSQGLNTGMMNDSTIPTDWFALRMDPIINSTNTNVSSGYGGLGPAIGDRDMLELLTNDEVDLHMGAQMQYNNNTY